MLISELIQELKDIQEKEGDLKIALRDWLEDWASPILLEKEYLNVCMGCIEDDAVKFDREEEKILLL